MADHRLTLIFSGTQMTWEATAILFNLGATQRHNLDQDEKAGPLYYIFDGPAAPVSEEHGAVEQMSFDQNTALPTAGERQAQHGLGRLFRFSRGTGTKHLVDTAYGLLCDLIVRRGVRHIDLFGFSRGGNCALLLGAHLNHLKKDLHPHLAPEEIDKLTVTLIASDPVAGKSRNEEAYTFGPLSPLVKTCIVGLATNESLPGFHPRDILSDDRHYNIRFLPGTRYVFLPFPDDHLMCALWMRDIVRAHLPADSPLRNACDNHSLVKRMLGTADVTWTDFTNHTFAYRLIHLDKNADRYQRALLPEAKSTDDTLKQTVELCFQHMSMQHTYKNIGHTSLQNDADGETKDRLYEGTTLGGAMRVTGQAQGFFARHAHSFLMRSLGLTERACKRKLEQYTNRLFMNLLHEAAFKKVYPCLHQQLLQADVTSHFIALRHLRDIAESSYPFTRLYVQAALDRRMRIEPLARFTVTNMTSLDDILATVTNQPRASLPIHVINTSNPEKIAAFKRLLQSAGFTAEQLDAITFKSVDLREVAAEPRTVAAMKAVMAADKHATTHVLIDDTSLDIEGEPDAGVNIRHLLEHAPERIKALAGKKAVFRCTLALMDAERVVHLAVGEVAGRMVEPRETPGVRSFGFDPVFEPDGSTLTLAQHKSAAVDARAHAIQRLCTGQVETFYFGFDEANWPGQWQAQDTSLTGRTDVKPAF